MKTDHSKTIFRKDYRPPAFQVERAELGFDLDPTSTVVATRLHLVRNTEGPLVLDGEGLTLLSIALDGAPLSTGAWRLEARGGKQTLSIDDLPARSTLDIAVRIAPATNTSLSGLYATDANLVTQCEAEGFRRIAFFPDRPDVMARFTVMLRADRERYPVLLSNGNLIDSGVLPDGRHYAKWEDPFPKPSYLFALVAGTFERIERRVRTSGGRDVLLQVYTQPAEIAKAGFALASLERALKWDEQRFGLELDLDRFMVVAVGDFNMGAMENKGLNIFNTKYVLVDEQTATDMDYAGVEAVIGHEYFHNWTGNRVTCRDWFQLTLKEGLTVFRDQEFSGDMATAATGGASTLDDASIRATLRIANVRLLRAAQFPEDAGPMAHPIRPESYQQINNFYTATVYQKGSEVVRMQHTLLGRDAFRAGMDEYFRRHDGEAVACEDFVCAMETAYARHRPGRDLGQFRRWYSQAGTPRVTATSDYDAATRRLTLTLRQICPRVGVERQRDVAKEPFHIPFAVGFVDRDGRSIPLALEGASTGERPTTLLLDFVDDEQRFVFTDVAREPVPSLLRGFSAPVIVDYRYADGDLALLSAHDPDPFNRWEAGQRLAMRELVRLSNDAMAGRALQVGDALVDVFRTTLHDATLDPALKEAALMLPSEGVVGEQLETFDPSAVRQARLFMIDALATRLADDWAETYRRHGTPGPYAPSWVDASRRALRNCALAYLARLDDDTARAIVDRQWADATNMTDRLAAFHAILNTPAHGDDSRTAVRRARVTERFYLDFRGDALVLDKWLRAQAIAVEDAPGALSRIGALTRHPAYAMANPNKVAALLGGFFAGNQAAFHRVDGRGHAFWARQIKTIDRINPSTAGRLARSLERWRRLAPHLRDSAGHALDDVRRTKGLSPDVLEIVEKALSV